MMNRGVLLVAALAQTRRIGAAALGVRSSGGAATADVGMKAWLSATPGSGESSNDNDEGPTPAETKLAFSSTVYGKDPASAAELTPAEAAAAAHLKQAAAAAAGGGKLSAATSRGHDARAMFDSSLSQQAEDGKSSGDIKRDVVADTPDATRVAFRASAYGKDPQMSAELSETEAAEMEELRARARGSSSGGAAPVHDSRNMFDSDFAQGAGDARASGDIKRDVTADTPDATRVAFKASVYGKDPQMAAELSETEAAEVGALRARAQGSSGGAAPLHDDRNMFDSDFAHGAGVTQASGDIKRDVASDTPEATRVAFRASAYGKDAQGTAEHSAQEAAEVEAMRKLAARSPGAGATAPVHDERSMFDSDLTHGAGSSRGSEAIKREVAADTPEATRLVFGGSDYGKDQESMARSAREQVEMDALAARSTKKESAAATATAGGAAPIHDDRSMFDSELTQGAGIVRDSGAIKREVTAGTPDKTRLAFKGSDYGKDVSLAEKHPDEILADVEKLQRRSRGGGGAAAMAAAVAAAGTRQPHAPVHHDRSMFDSDLTQGAGTVEEYGEIKRDVQAETPALTRLSFFGSTYGDEDPGGESAEGAEELATKQAKGEKLATVGRGARKSKVHDTKKAMADDEYSQAGSE